MNPFNFKLPTFHKGAKVSIEEIRENVEYEIYEDDVLIFNYNNETKVMTCGPKAHEYTLSHLLRMKMYILTKGGVA